MGRRKPPDGGGGPNWLDTYSDMVTLLLTFFVMLFAMSTMDSSKWQKLVQAFSANKGSAASLEQMVANASTPSKSSGNSINVSSGSQGGAASNATGQMTFDDLYQYIKGYVDQKGLTGSVDVHKGDGYTFITFQNSIFFTGDSAVLRDEGKGILDYLSGGLKLVSSQIGEIRFYGHTARADANETKEMQAFDRQLSSDRATNVLLYMQYKNVVDPKKMVSEGYGEFRPLVPHDGTEATRIKNRRVDIYISRSGTVGKTLDEIYEQINSSGKATVTSTP